MVLLNIELTDGTECDSCKNEFKKGEVVEAFSETIIVMDREERRTVWDHVKCPI